MSDSQCACGEREECDHSCMPDVIDGFCSLCSEPVNENVRLRRVLDQIAREGECVYARRLALNALATSPLSSQEPR